MIRTGDHALVKQLNKSIVLNVLRSKSPVSRTDISKLTGLNKATVSVIMDELLAEDLVIELGHGPSTVGRRPVMCRFNPQAGMVIGLQIEVDSVSGVLTDLAGNIIREQVEVVDSLADIDVAKQAIKNVVDPLLSHATGTRLGVLGIGVGVPGLVNYSTGVVRRAPNLHWNNVPLRSFLESEWPYSILVDNEANAGALGEKLFGIGRDYTDLVYISVGHGIGAGIVVNGELVRGVHGLAGEFGHMTIEVNGHKCSCDGRGCLEMYASEKAVKETIRISTGEEWPTARVFEQLAKGNRVATEAVRLAGRFLGIGISNIANGLDTSLIVIGNRMANGGSVFLESVRESFYEYCFSHSLSKTNIELSQLGKSACALGAASLVVHEYFSIPKMA